MEEILAGERGWGRGESSAIILSVFDALIKQCLSMEEGERPSLNEIKLELTNSFEVWSLKLSGEQALENCEEENEEEIEEEKEKEEEEEEEGEKEKEAR
ncbi:uncharacterized protein MONOS_10615 [Monocercomonoides exilis]|uniref:uncharacterized protein n=1 Tax=Monocercomonoides exilis TaxID=2049356 RepID=UPI003559EF38|nr:hypothetical protein MONOS_10615 [Monocercomonoides exilis]|eukprot:MONOS_10615.1-p1 / transcript=MONOS_10615.1 / gene=MONOS_10615 / organism=Monocercomonoides_exilis_PA203 / gene_product=unspecified product / transcript_product=unspecified product / location=Mono_scaffold00490:512-808(-) / protein_length=99 / sequence_SO=supercontig / SO=protein_coding / is_pseudo=false